MSRALLRSSSLSWCEATLERRRQVRDLRTSVSHHERDDIEANLGRTRLVLAHPASRKSTKALLLTPIDRLGRQTPRIATPSLYLAKHHESLSPRDDVDLALAHSIVAVQDIEPARLVEGRRHVLAVLSQYWSGIHGT